MIRHISPTSKIGSRMSIETICHCRRKLSQSFQYDDAEDLKVR